MDRVMARPLRIKYEGAFYHITARGNERKKIFFAKSDYAKFKEYVKGAQDRYGYLLHCYVLMSNHYHLILETPNADLSKIMHSINGSYTGYINRRRRRSGHLFQGRYKSILVDVDSYLLELSRYVHLNPVRAKMVKRAEDYTYSSYRSFISKKKEDIIHRDLILGMISKSGRNSEKIYREFVEKSMEEDLEDPLKDSYAGSILGGKGFIKEALNRLRDGCVIEKEETSHRTELQVAFATEQIIDTIASYFGLSPEQVLKERGDYRNIAIHLMKKLTSITNKQIGDLFGGLSFTAVSKANQRFMMRMKNDKKLRRRVDDVLRNMSHIKG
jgi:REP element-mobilizing transposase RayT